MPGEDTKITCGTVGKPCKSLDDYPICHPKDEEAGWVGLEEIIVCENENGTKDFRLLPPGAAAPEECITSRPPQWKDVAETKYEKEDEIPQLLKGDFLNQVGLKGVCRSPYMGGGKPSSWYGYVDHAGHAAYLTLYNKGYPTPFHDQRGIELEYAEMMGLAACDELMLQKDDVVCSRVPELKRDEDEKGNVERSYSPGKYHFKKDSHFLEDLLKVLKDDDIKIDGLTVERRKTLVKYFEKIYDKETAQLQFLENTSWVQWLSAVSAVLVSAYFGRMMYKEIKEKFIGRVKPSSVDDELKAKLEEHPEYDILGRDREAKAFWRKAGKKIGFKNILINAPTGVGKDIVVEKALLMKIKQDPAVPKEWRDAKVLAVDCGEVMKGAELRGKVGQAALEIVDTMPKKQGGKVIIWMKEADILLSFGATSKDNAETPGKIFLSYLEKKYQRENVLFVLTTSRGKELLSEYPDLQRRTNAVIVEEFSTEKIIEIASGPKKAMYEKLYGVEMDPKAVEQTMRIAEGLYRPELMRRNGETLARFPAFDAVLEEAFVIAEEEGLPRIDKDVIVRAVGDLLNASWDPKDPLIEEMLKMPLEDLEARTAQELQKYERGQVGSALEAQIRSALTAMSAGTPPLETDDPIIREMERHPEYKKLQFFEKQELAQAMETLMAELKGRELYRFFDETTGRFLEGKFEILARATRKGGLVTKADLIVEAEKVEKADPKARKDAEKAAENFAMSKGGKK